jgi:hypothetical protein
MPLCAWTRNVRKPPDSVLAIFAGIFGLPFVTLRVSVSLSAFHRKARPGHTVALLDS